MTTIVTDHDTTIGEVADERGRRVLLATTGEEWHALAHLRGWCHDMRSCPTCTTVERVEERTYSALRALLDAARAAAIHRHEPFPQYRGKFNDWVLGRFHTSYQGKGFSEWSAGDYALISPDATSAYNVTSGSICAVDGYVRRAYVR